MKTRSIDIEVEITSEIDHVANLSLRSIIEPKLNQPGPFTLSFITPSVFEGLVKLMVQKGEYSEEQAQGLILVDLTQEYGSDIANEVFEYVLGVQEFSENLRKMYEVGMEEGFLRKLGITVINTPTEFNPESLSGLKSELEHIQAELDESNDDNELGQVWKDFGIK